MIKTRQILLAIFGLLLASFVEAQSTNITFVVKDQHTGFAVPGASVQVTAPNGKTSTLTTGTNGKLVYVAVNGKYNFLITASGFKPIETFFSSGDETNIEANVTLDHATNAEPQVSETQLRAAANQTILNGYIRDANTNGPLAGAQVSAGGKTATTDSKGYFSIQLNADAAAIAQGATPEKIAIRFSKTGYTSHTIQNYLIPETYTMKVGLNPASGARTQAIEETETHVHGMFDRKESDDAQRYSETAVPQARVESALAATVPTSIRVGTSCSCTTCSSVSVMSLEQYAQSGLDDEWIASWKTASLQAGSIAYRTYGAWYVLHPVKTNFDIASSTCNQVWNSDVVTSCKNAAISTAGIVLVKNGAIFRAEYSSENNNAGCGNGYSGTGTSNGWPCIKDERCAGRALYGHGRGMCQYGTSFWASDKDYVWIVNHYYNPGSVYMQTPTPPAVTTITFNVKDMSTGLAVATASVKVTKPDGTTATVTTDASGKLTYGINAGKYTFAVTKSGYTALSTSFTGVAANAKITANINLDPTSSARVVTGSPLVKAPANSMTLTGYVRDADQNTPLTGVQVNAGSYTATTNAQGFFTLTVPAEAVAQGKVPAAISIQSSKAGYISNSIKNLYAIPDTYEMQIALTAVTSPRALGLPASADQVIRRHGLFDKTVAEQLEFIAPQNSAAITAREEGSAVTAALAVPAVIRVSTNCACATTCAEPVVEVMSLESYVQTGLDDEWVSSWNANSLQAGTVAYRTRGAWFVQNPAATNYDLSSAACHQTWQTDRATSVKNAAVATAGIVLIKNGAIYLAEYCAESNNSGCGNGFSGTSTDYPCIADARCAGKTKSGHGRGMCQWGSSYWGTDQTYSWILNHYYNPDTATVQTSAAAVATSSTSDSRMAEAGTLKLAPNPATGSAITVEYTLADASQPASIVITDNFGQIVQQRSVVLQQGINRLAVNTGGLKAGIYNVTILPGATGKATSRKLLIVK
jgi:peptidoglycan hydrolase-like amidase